MSIKFDNSKDIENYFKKWKLNKEGQSYLKDHSKRYLILLNLIDKVIEEIGERNIKVLDIGPSFQTELIRKCWPDCIVDTLGFRDNNLKPGDRDSHIEFDLNNCRDVKNSPSGPYQIIIFCEVLEHLYTDPNLIFDYLSKRLDKDGYLIIQTPNAVSLRSRIKMLLGRSPYEPIRENIKNPSHFHEYIKSEIYQYAKVAKLKVISFSFNNYFRKKNKIMGFVYNMVCSVFPSTKDGITLVVKKTK